MCSSDLFPSHDTSFQEEIIKRVDSTMAIKVLNIKVELKDIENTSKIKLEAK